MNLFFNFKNRDGVTSANFTTFGMFGSMIFIISKKEDYYKTKLKLARGQQLKASSKQ